MTRKEQVILMELMLLSAGQLTVLGNKALAFLESKRDSTPPEQLVRLEMLIVCLSALSLATDLSFWGDCVKLLAMFLGDLDPGLIAELDARSKMSYEERMDDLTRFGKVEHDSIEDYTSGNDSGRKGSTGSGGGPTLN